MPMIATSGLSRFGGLSAASVASVSACAIGGTAAEAGIDGSEAIQPAPIARKRTTAPKPLHRTLTFPTSKSRP